MPALLVTRAVDTGPGGENDPNRALVAIRRRDRRARAASDVACESRSRCRRRRCQWLGDVAPVRVRKLFFSEKQENPNDPNSATKFFLTTDGEAPKPFDPQSNVPDIVVRQGDVEDWIIENRSMELHAFHIHQIHFMLLRLVRHCRQRAVSARYGQRPLLQRPDAAAIPACGFAWIFAIPTSSARSSTTATFSSTKTAE